VIAVVLAGCAPIRLASVTYRAPAPTTDDATGFEHIDRALRVLRAPGTPAPRRAPIAVTLDDGSELVLASLRGRAAIDGPLAATELELTFDTPAGRELGGSFAIALPAGASVSGLAVGTGSAWQDGKVMVEPARRGASAPAPLDPGGSVLRVPIRVEASAPLHVRVRYTQEVGATHPYRLALAGLPALRELDIEVTGGTAPVAIHGPASAPADVVVAAAGSDALIAGDAVIVRVAPDLPATADPITELAILVDTSGSRGAMLRDQARAIRELLGVLAPRGLAHVEVAAFDQSVVPLFAGTPAEVAAAIEDAVVARGAFGASDLAGALLWASGRGIRTLVVGDGAATAGPVTARAIARRVQALPRVDALALGGVGDRAVLSAVVARGDRAGAILTDQDAGAAAWADRLERPAIADAPIAIDGAAWVWPERVGSVQAGDDIVIVARLLPGAKTDKLTVRLGAATTTVSTRSAGPALVDRAVAIAEIARAESALDTLADDAARVAAVEGLASLAAEHHVLTGRTALRIGGLAVELVAGAPVLDSPLVRATEQISRPDVPSGVDYFRESRNGTYVVLADYKVEIGAERIAPATKWDGVRIGRPDLHGPQDGTDFRGPRLPLGWDEAHHQQDRWVSRTPHPPENVRPAWDGRFADTMAAIAAGEVDRAIADAIAWHVESPDELVALVALGEALEARGSSALAARAYGSILDRFPDRPEAARAAGQRLERTGATDVAIAAYRRAVALDPRSAAAHRMLAWALVRTDDLDGALAAIEAGYQYARDAAGTTARVFREDFAMIGAAMAVRAPGRRAELEARGVAVDTLVEQPATVRFVLQWENHGADVDLHVVDRRNNRAWHEHPQLGYLGWLAGDDIATQPEQFVLPLGDAHQGPYRLAAWVDAGTDILGALQIIEYDGRGRFVFDHRSFVATRAEAYVDLGTWE
jgi:tetratricopeptide (TPR) repeat protein